MIQPGILGCDGVVRGAMTDLECFASFNIELPDGSDLWEFFAIREQKPHEMAQYVKTSEAVLQRALPHPRKTVDELRAFYAANEAAELSPWPEPEEMHDSIDTSPARILFSDTE